MLWRITSLAALCWILLANVFPRRTQGAPGFESWKAQLQVTELGYGETTERSVETGQPYTHASAGVTTYVYNLYQNERNVVRRELVRMSRNPVAETGRELRLLDYRAHYVVDIDESAKRALRRPMANLGTATPIEGRRILGYHCIGLQYQWIEGDRTRHVETDWKASGTSFQEPLLSIEYAIDSNNSLLYLELRAVRRLEPSGSLDPALFEAPPGFEVVTLDH